MANDLMKAIKKVKAKEMTGGGKAEKETLGEKINFPGAEKLKEGQKNKNNLTKMLKKMFDKPDEKKYGGEIKKMKNGGDVKNPNKADLDKDGKLSGYEKKRGMAIEKAMGLEGGGTGFVRGMGKAYQGKPRPIKIR